MPRKAFVHDLQQAPHSFSHDRIADVESGVEDGSVTFTYTYQPAGIAIVIQALVTGTSFLSPEGRRLMMLPSRCWRVSYFSHVHDLHHVGEHSGPP